MLPSKLLISLAGLIPFSTAGYVLQDDYSIDKFFSMFEFFTVSPNCKHIDLGFVSGIHFLGRR